MSGDKMTNGMTKHFGFNSPEGGFIVVGQMLSPVRLILGGLLISKCIMHFANYCRFNSARSFWLVRLIPLARSN